LVAVKLDADSEKFLEYINRPSRKVTFARILAGIKQFRKEYRGKLALQSMFIDENRFIVKNIAKITESINPDEIQICTAKRTPKFNTLSKKTTLQIQRYFRKLNSITFYTFNQKKVRPLSRKSTELRRGPIIS